VSKNNRISTTIWKIRYWYKMLPEESMFIRSCFLRRIPTIFIKTKSHPPCHDVNQYASVHIPQPIFFRSFIIMILTYVPNFTEIRSVVSGVNIQVDDRRKYATSQLHVHFMHFVQRTHTDCVQVWRPWWPCRRTTSPYHPP
jgi:hypothetical protein